tara:strand:+ start:446 stop:1573 length:1128 start_codon:yes stop_codon:yes gene_type:complete
MGKINKAFGIENKTIHQRLMSSLKDKSFSIKLLNRFLRLTIRIIEKLFITKIITYHTRPKISSDFHIRSLINKKHKAGILIQGPIDHDKSFTVETIKLYKKLYPEIPIILSTWEDEEKNALNLIRNLGVDIAVSKKPKIENLQNSLWKNVDLQIISVKEGIKAFAEYDIDHCLKTRTDQRIYKPELFNFFINLMNAFPLKNNSTQKKRIISSSFATAKYRVYGLTDMMMFAEISDLKRYWNVENYSSGIYKYSQNNEDYIPPIVSGTLIGAEVYLMSSYLERIGVKLDWTLSSYWKSLGEYFLIADSNSMDMYWNKYNKESEFKYARTYDQVSHRLIDFSDWLEAYSDHESLWDSLRSQEKWERSSDGKLKRTVI